MTGDCADCRVGTAEWSSEFEAWLCDRCWRIRLVQKKTKRFADSEEQARMLDGEVQHDDTEPFQGSYRVQMLTGSADFIIRGTN